MSMMLVVRVAQNFGRPSPDPGARSARGYIVREIQERVSNPYNMDQVVSYC